MIDSHVEFTLLQQCLERTPTVAFETHGGSMRPLVQPGDTITVRRCPLANFVAGDLACFRLADRLICHRVLQVHAKGATLCAKGDATPRPDPPVSEADLLGRVTRITRGRQTTDLDRPTARLLGSLIAVASPWSWLWRPLARRLWSASL